MREREELPSVRQDLTAPTRRPAPPARRGAWSLNEFLTPTHSEPSRTDDDPVTSAPSGTPCPYREPSTMRNVRGDYETDPRTAAAGGRALVVANLPRPMTTGTGRPSQGGCAICRTRWTATGPPWPSASPAERPMDRRRRSPQPPPDHPRRVSANKEPGDGDVAARCGEGFVGVVVGVLGEHPDTATTATAQATAKNPSRLIGPQERGVVHRTNNRTEVCHRFWSQRCCLRRSHRATADELLRGNAWKRHCACGSARRRVRAHRPLCQAPATTRGRHG